MTEILSCRFASTRYNAANVEKLPVHDPAGGTVQPIRKVIEMDDIQIGYGVYCGNDKVGEVARLVADASDSHVTDLVVDRGLLHGAKLIPLQDLKDVQAGRVELAITRQQFLDADGFTNPRFREPHDAWSCPPGYDSAADFLIEAEVDAGSASGFGAVAGPVGFPPSPADPRPNNLRPLIREGTPVQSSTGEKVGEIGQVSFNPEDGRLDSVTLKRGLLGRDHLQLPLDWIEGFDGEGLVLHVSKEQVEQLPNKT